MLPASIALFLFTYWIYAYRPIAFYPQAAVDDALHLRHAYAIIEWLRGSNPRWLGDYDWALLAKAPLYGVFQAAYYVLGVPIRIGEYFILVGIPFFFVVAVRPLVLIRSWSFLATAALLMWLPLLPSETHLLRNALQTMLTSYLIISAIGLALRWGSNQRAQVGWAALLGLFFSLCYLNREEASWLGAVVAFSYCLHCFLSKVHGVFRWQRAVATGLVVAMSASPLIILVSSLNYQSYGVFLTTFRRSSAFTAAYQRLTSLEPHLHKRYVPISRETRFRAYELSPTFAKLKPHMEGNATYWVAGNDEHSALNGYQQSDREFFISSYEFALQYTVSITGGTNAVLAEQMFRNIDQELGTAIENGQIEAGMHGPSILAAPVSGDLTRLLGAWWRSFYYLLTLRQTGIHNWNDGSVGTPSEFDRASLFLNSSLARVPHGSLQYQMRIPVIQLVNKVLRITYWISILALLFVCLLGYARHRAFFLRGIVVASIPVIALTLSCFTMAIVDTLGFPFLGGMGYNVLGFAPLSVLSAFAVAITLAYVRERRPT